MSIHSIKIANSPLATAIKVALVILGGEFTIMLSIEGILMPIIGHDVPFFFWEFLDPLLLTIIVAPVLHLYVLRPMKAQQMKLERQKDELRIAAVTFNAQEGVVVTDANHKILKVNQAFTDVTGYSSAEAVGKTPAIVGSGRQDSDFYRRMHEMLEHDKCWQGEIWNRRKNGEIYPEWLTITAVSGEKGQIYYVGIFADITQRKAAEGKIKYLAYHDQLTGLPNRELFYDRLSMSMSQARRKLGRIALLYLDLDGFKPINDSFGHEAGDAVLRKTSKRLLACVRDADTVARLGGDEFAIILDEIESPADVNGIAEKIIRKLNEPLLLHDGCECSIGVSIGISIFPEDGGEIDRLMSAADSAMYESKSTSSKNTYTFFKTPTHGTVNNQPWIVIDDAHFLGVPEMDQQHSGLVDILNKLNDSVRKNEPSGVLIHLFDELTKQIRFHFESEDALMDFYSYTGSEAHKKEHQRLIKELDYLRVKFIHGSELLVLQSLKDWLLSHVTDWDRNISNFLLQPGKRKI